MTKCRRCNRPLRNPAAIIAGIGPVCARKLAQEKEFNDAAIEADRILSQHENGAAEVARGADGVVRATVAHLIKYHSPSGFEFGYGGSGPADLALNILHAYLPEGRTMDVKGVLINPIAWTLHQSFKDRFIATMGREGGIISRAEIMAFLSEGAE